MKYTDRILAGINLRLKIIGINIVNTFLRQSAYFGNNLGSVLSTTFYTLALFVFIKVLYSNVDTFAGYTENESMLLILFTQLSFYSEWLWSTNNILGMIEDVNTGNLDLVLTKPIPSLFYITFKEISFINRIKDGLPNLIILSILINWNDLDIQNIWTAVLIFVLGQIAWHCLRFICALPVFWLGESNQIFQLAGTFGETKRIPYEGFGKRLRLVFTAIIPSLLLSQLSVSVLLGKSDPYMMMLLSGTVASGFLILKVIAWNNAIKNYTSASS